MTNDYFQFCKALYKKVSWANPRNLPKRKDLVSDDYLALVGGAISILITLTAVFSPFGLAVIGALIGLGVLVPLVVWPVLKGVAKVGLALAGLGFDIMAAPFKLVVSLYNRITGKGNSSAPQAAREAINGEAPKEKENAVEKSEKNDHAAPAIESNAAFVEYLEKLKKQSDLQGKLIEKKSTEDPTKTVSASVTLDTDGLVDTTSKRTFTISEVNGETILKLDLSAKAAIDPADREKLLEQMCRTAINNELSGSAFQVHPNMGTKNEQAELQKILNRVRAEKAAPSLVAVPVAAPVPIAANEAAAQPAAPAPLPAPESVILAVTPVVDPVAAPVAEPVVAASEQAKERGAPPPAGQGRRARPPPAARSSLKSPKDPVQALQSVVEQNQEAAAPEVKAAVVTPVSHQQIKTPPPRPSKPSNTEVSDALTPAQRAAEGRRDLNLRLIAKEPARDLNAPSAVVPAAAGGSVRSSAIYPANLEISVEDNKVAAAALSESPLDKAITPGYHLLFAAHRVPRAAGVLSEVELEHKHETRNSR